MTQHPAPSSTAGSGSGAAPARDRGSVGVVWTVIFLDLLGFGLVLPSIAYFVQSFPLPDFLVELGPRLGFKSITPLFVASIQTAYSLLQFVCAPLWGRLSDRIGRRPVLTTTMAGFAVAWGIFAFAPSIWWLLVARAFAGAFGANVATAQAYLADVYPPEQRAKAMGLIGMAFGLGFVIGPVIGALLSSDLVLTHLYAPGSSELLRGRTLIPGVFAAAFSSAAFLVALFRLKESLPKEKRISTPARANELAELFDALRQPGIRPMLLVYFVVVCGFANMESMFSQFNIDRLQLPQSANSSVFACVGLVMAAVQGGLIGRLTSRYGSPSVLKAGLVGLATALIAFGFQTQLNPGAPPLVWLVLIAGMTSATFSLCNPSVLAIIANLAKERAQGGTAGFTASSATLGRVIGPLMGGLIYSALGPEWPFAFGGVLVALAFVIFALRAPAAR